MAKTGNTAASAPVVNDTDPNDPWGHVRPDADGSVAFDSEADARAYAKAKGVDVSPGNMQRIGVVTVLLDGSKKAAQKSSDDSKKSADNKKAADTKKAAADTNPDNNPDKQ